MILKSQIFIIVIALGCISNVHTENMDGDGIITTIPTEVADNADELLPTKVEDDVKAEVESTNPQTQNSTEAEVINNEPVPKADANATQSVNGTRSKVTCKGRNNTELTTPILQIVNGSKLLSLVLLKSNSSEAECYVVMFYASWCQFSANAAPHFNALPRLFSNVTFLAVNTIAYSGLNTRFGIVAVPTILLFHNGHAVAKFNDSHYTLDNFATFVNRYTGLQATGSLNVTQDDIEGPLPNDPIQETDMQLVMAWCFIILCCLYGFSKSSICQQMIESIRNDWREAEAQHEHAD